jgi:hypothetical protein
MDDTLKLSPLTRLGGLGGPGLRKLPRRVAQVFRKPTRHRKRVPHVSRFWRLGVPRTSTRPPAPIAFAFYLFLFPVACCLFPAFCDRPHSAPPEIRTYYPPAALPRHRLRVPKAIPSRLRTSAICPAPPRSATSPDTPHPLPSVSTDGTRQRTKPHRQAVVPPTPPPTPAPGSVQNRTPTPTPLPTCTKNGANGRLPRSGASGGLGYREPQPAGIPIYSICLLSIPVPCCLLPVPCLCHKELA